MELKARDASLWAKITAEFVLIVGAVLKWIGVFSACSITELCIVAFTIAGLFGTVDINLMFEKIWGKTVDQNLMFEKIRGKKDE